MDKIIATDTGYCDQPMIADWKLDLMAKFIFQNLWIERKDIILRTCKLIKDSYRIGTPKKVNLTGVTAQIEKYKNKRNVLLEMRTDGEITKEEYAEQKSKIDSALTELENEYQMLLQTEEEIKTSDICWDKIQQALEEMLDFSQPNIDQNIIRKFVSKIVPNGRTHFRWYMNLDGRNDTSLDLVVEGRKKQAVVSFDDGGENPPLHTGEIISVNTLQKEVERNIIGLESVGSTDEKSSVVSILHRQISRTPESNIKVNFTPYSEKVRGIIYGFCIKLRSV